MINRLCKTVDMGIKYSILIRLYQRVFAWRRITSTDIEHTDEIAFFFRLFMFSQPTFVRFEFSEVLHISLTAPVYTEKVDVNSLHCSMRCSQKNTILIIEDLLCVLRDNLERLGTHFVDAPKRITLTNSSVS